MRLYFVGVGGNKRMLEYYIESGLNDNPDAGLLVSYAYKRHFQACVDAGVKQIMVDSGAFTVAKKAGRSIDMDEYLKFLEAGKEHITTAFALDVIFDAEKSVENYEYMRAVFPRIMPVWHMGEELELLDYYADRTDYVGLGGFAISEQRMTWERFAPVISKVFGRQPGLKIHGLGINNPRAAAFPFYSVDALSWANGSIYSQIIMPNGQRWWLGYTDKAISSEEAEQLGIGKALRDFGAPWPIGEGDARKDYEWRWIDFFNMHSLVNIFCTEHQPEITAHSISLF